MLIKDELAEFLNVHMAGNSANNKKRILYIYGFEDGEFHTGEDSYDRYKDKIYAKQNTEAKNKRAGASEVITQFKQKIKEFPLNSLKMAAKILKQHKFLSAAEYMMLLDAAELIEIGKTNAIRILQLLHETGICLNFGIYGHDLKNLTHPHKKTADLYSKTFFIENSFVESISAGLDYAERLPGDIGLARKTHLKNKFPKDNDFVDYIIELIKANNTNLVIDGEDDIYFFVEKGKNTLVNKLGKVFNVAQTVDIDELSTVLHQSFSSRGKVDPQKYPSRELIQKFIKTYRLLTVTEDIVTYNGPKSDLMPIEIDIVKFFSMHSSAKWNPLKKFLQKERKGESGLERYGEARLADVYSLPILFQKGDRPNITFFLVGSSSLASSLEDAVLGGCSGIDSVRRRRKTSEKELADAQNKATQVGKMGEQLINDYLQKQKRNRIIDDFSWDSKDDVYSPHDFTVMVKDSKTYIDVKTTEYKFSNAIHISYGELLKMQESEIYLIYRVYEIKDQPKLRISKNLNVFSKDLIKTLKKLPPGITPDSFSVFTHSCKTIEFEDSITL